jgi:hypothetical protein
VRNGTREGRDYKRGGEGLRRGGRERKKERKRKRQGWEKEEKGKGWDGPPLFIQVYAYCRVGVHSRRDHIESAGQSDTQSNRSKLGNERIMIDRVNLIKLHMLIIGNKFCAENF